MIKLDLEDKTFSFNLKNFETEQKLYKAWYSMQGDPKFESKRIKITTDKNEKLDLKIEEIKDCKFEDSIYVLGEVHEEKQKKRKPDFRDDPMDDILKNLNKNKEDREKENIKKFLIGLKANNAPIDFKDPFLQQIINNVRGDNQSGKIPFYVNIYANSRKGKR